jgi:hypothetical protein
LNGRAWRENGKEGDEKAEGKREWNDEQEQGYIFIVN